MDCPSSFLEEKSGEICICVDYCELNQKSTNHCLKFRTAWLEAKYSPSQTCSVDIGKENRFCLEPFQFTCMPFGLTGPLVLTNGCFSWATLHHHLYYVMMCWCTRSHCNITATTYNLFFKSCRKQGKLCKIAMSKVQYLDHVF